MSAPDLRQARRERRAGAATAMQPWTGIGLVAVVGASFAKTFGAGVWDLVALTGFLLGLVCLLVGLIRYFQFLKANPLP